MPHVNERREEDRLPEGPDDRRPPGRRADEPEGGPVQPAGGQRVDPSTDDAGLATGEETDEGEGGAR